LADKKEGSTNILVDKWLQAATMSLLVKKKEKRVMRITGIMESAHGSFLHDLMLFTEQGHIVYFRP